MALCSHMQPNPKFCISLNRIWVNQAFPGWIFPTDLINRLFLSHLFHYIFLSTLFSCPADNSQALLNQQSKNTLVRCKINFSETFYISIGETSCPETRHLCSFCISIQVIWFSVLLFFFLFLKLFFIFSVAAENLGCRTSGFLSRFVKP